MYMPLYFILRKSLRVRGCTCEQNRNFIGVAGENEKQGSGFKGSGIAMVLIKLVRTGDWREIKKQRGEIPWLRRNETKNDNRRGCTGQVYTTHFPILRQKYYKFENNASRFLTWASASSLSSQSFRVPGFCDCVIYFLNICMCISHANERFMQNVLFREQRKL